MNCTFCNKETSDGANYCGWSCHVGHSTALGGKVVAPNGLAATCFRHDGTMLEHEHADHPDYKHPVEVVWVGKELEEIYRNMFGRTLTDDEIRNAMGEHHALIYTDGTIAVTLYEYTYHTWYLKSGKPMSKRDEGFLLKSLEIPEIFKRMK